MGKSDNSIIEIAPIPGEILPAVRLGSGLSALVNALNPLGTIGNAITEIIAYSIASKKLGVERERIRKQAEVIDTTIKARLAYELRQFDLQREALLACLEHSENVLKDRRISKEAVIKSMDNIGNLMVTLPQQKNVPLEVYSVYGGVLSDLTGKLVELEKAGTNEVIALSQQLHVIVGEVRRELEDMPPVNKLFPPSP